MQLNSVWKKRLSLSSRTLRRVVIIVVVATSCINGVALLWRFAFPSEPPAIAGISRTVVNETDAVKAFATMCVTSLLTATTASATDLARCYPSGAKYAVPTTNTMIISNAVAWASRRGPTNSDVTVYSVKIALTLQPYPLAPRTMAYYQIPVGVYQDSGFQALDRIGRIEGPPPGAYVPLGYSIPIAAGTPLFTMLAGFVTAYLTASGGLDRFTTTDAAITSVGCYASASITIAQAAEQPAATPAQNTELPVHIDVSARRSDYTQEDLSYSLTLRALGGTWFVAQIDAIPVFSDQGATPVPISPPAASSPPPK